MCGQRRLVTVADDGHRVVYQIQLERNGDTIKGNLRKLIAYPEGINHLESIAKCDSPVVCLAAAKSPHCNSCLYYFDMESREVTNMLESMTDNCREIKKVARFKATLVFTDVGGRQVKWYNPSTKNVETRLPQMEAKERKMGLKKLAAASFKSTAFAVFQMPRVNCVTVANLQFQLS